MSAENVNFIKTVEKFPSLWRKEDKDFCNQVIRKRLYEILSRETGIPVDACKRKLKGFKDRMRELCHRLPRMKSGEPAFETGENLVSWPYYKYMLFMADQFRSPRPRFDHSDVLMDDNYDVEYNVALNDDTEYEDGEGDNVDEENTNQDSKEMILLRTEDNSNSQPDAKEQIVKRHHTSSSSVRRGVKRSLRDSSAIMAAKMKGARDESDNLSNDDSNNSANDFSSESLQNLNVSQVLSPYYHNTTRPKPMWDVFAEDISNDLKLVTDPLLQIETKAQIRRIVEQAVHNQLTKI